jgi:hypothetical protein
MICILAQQIDTAQQVSSNGAAWVSAISAAFVALCTIVLLLEARRTRRTQSDPCVVGMIAAPTANPLFFDVSFRNAGGGPACEVKYELLVHLVGEQGRVEKKAIVSERVLADVLVQGASIFTLTTAEVSANDIGRAKCIECVTRYRSVDGHQLCTPVTYALPIAQSQNIDPLRDIANQLRALSRSVSGSRFVSH